MLLVPSQLRKFWNYGSGRMTLAAFCAHSVSISIGICQGYSAILIPQLKSSLDFTINSEESSWIASLGAITNPIGAILSGLLAEYFGRKRSIQISSIPFLIGWLLIATSTTLPIIYIGRLITGIGAGMSSASYIYVAEISTSKNRGLLQSFGPICASFGILLTYILGYLIDWTIIAWINLIFGLFTLIFMQLLPESPAYILQKKSIEKSFEIYYYFRRNNLLAQEEIDRHLNNNNLSNDKFKEATFKDKFLCPETVKPFIILIVLFFLQELSGIYTILFYAIDFFDETNLNINSYLSSIIIGIIRLIMSIIMMILINKFHRKFLCILSSSGMSFTMLFLIIYMKYYEISSPSTDNSLITTSSDNFNKHFDNNLIPLICIILNVLFSMIGMLPIPWILIGELFPLNVRSIMSGIVICIAQCFIFICIKIYPNLLDLFKFSGTLCLFLVASVLTIVFCKFYLIETKNKCLYEIENEFRGRNKLKTDTNCYDNKGFVLNNDNIQIFTINNQS